MQSPDIHSTASWLPLRDFFIAEALAVWATDRQDNSPPASFENLNIDGQISLLCQEHWFAKSLWRQLELIEFFAERARLRAFVRRHCGDDEFAFADAGGAWRSVELDPGQAFEWLLCENGLKAQ